MAACEDGLAPVSALADKALVDELWTYLQGPGVPETQWGTTVQQCLYGIQHLGEKYGKQTSYKLATTVDDVLDETFDHGMFAEANLMGLGEHHWLLRRKGADWSQGGFIHVDDSALSLDYDPGQFPAQAVADAGVRLMGPGQPFGILWTWT